MFEWMKDYQGLLWTVFIASVVIFIASLFVIPALVVRIKPDYFAAKSARRVHGPSAPQRCAR